MKPPNAGEITIPPGPVPRRRLGRTDQMVSAIGLGGYHLGMAAEADAIRIVHAAIDRGLDFMDNCWDYNGGRSEELMGKALAGSRRAQVFLMSKVDGRTRKAAAEQLDQSLGRLATDMIDLVQIHEVIRMDDAERVFEPEGALAALLEARAAGKVRFIGFTGHKDPAMMSHMLDVARAHGTRFDTVQLPLNVMDPHFRSFETNLLPRLVAEDIGVLGMKPFGAGQILSSGVVTAEECLRYSLTLPTSVVVTGCETLGVLEQALAFAIGFAPMSPAERQSLLARTRPHADAGQFEGWKSTHQFDGTAQNPHWMEEARL
jgi:aryl-alcohol dehydrogenase-like predicted oxidoreductase